MALERSERVRFLRDSINHRKNKLFVLRVSLNVVSQARLIFLHRDKISRLLQFNTKTSDFRSTIAIDSKLWCL